MARKKKKKKTTRGAWRDVILMIMTSVWHACQRGRRRGAHVRVAAGGSIINIKRGDISSGAGGSMANNQGSMTSNQRDWHECQQQRNSMAAKMRQQHVWRHQRHIARHHGVQQAASA